MDAVEYFKEKKRMCDTQDSCSKCPLCDPDPFDDAWNNYCHTIESIFPSRAVEIVKEWTKENPIYTNLDKFKEIFDYIILSKREFEIDSFFDWLNEEYIEPTIVEVERIKEVE